MQIKILIYIVALLAALSLPAYGLQDGVSLKYPPDKTVMEYGLMNISLYVPSGSADKIKANVNGEEAADITPKLEYVCFSISLKLGINSIDISALKGGDQVYNAALSVFRRSELEGEFIKVPAGYRKDNFHMGDRSECAECHRMQPTEYDKRPISPASFAATTFDKDTLIAATSTCYSCHKKITSLPYVHGPAAVWSCLSCHDSEAGIKYSVKKPDTEVCFGCHTEQKEEWGSKKVVHGPVTLGKCTICHSPHSAAYPFNLYKSRWDLCVNCHAEKGSGKHVLGDAFSTEGHPTRGKPDPIRIGKELSCSSCHQPHASNIQHLWAFEVSDMFELCTKCHSDKKVK